MNIDKIIYTYFITISHYINMPMLENLTENYVTASLWITNSNVYPFNYIFLIIGVILGLIFIFPHFKYLQFKISSKIKSTLSTITKWFKQWNEPIGWLGVVISSFGIIVSISSLVLNHGYFKEQEKTELKAICEFNNKLHSIKKHSVIADIKCKVKNTGNKTTSIDTVEPIMYFSKEVKLNRNITDRIHISSPISVSIKLPLKLESGEQVNFETSVIIPIEKVFKSRSKLFLKKIFPGEKFDESKIKDVYVQMFETCLQYRQSDFKDNKILMKFNETLGNYCFAEILGKPIPNYLYEGTRLPYSNILVNGIGIRITYFDKEINTEIDMVTGSFYNGDDLDDWSLNDDLLHMPFYSDINETIKILSSNSTFYRRNIGKRWYSKEYPYCFANKNDSNTLLPSFNNDESGKSCTINNFTGATIFNLFIVLSLFGWLKLSLFIYNFLKKIKL